MSCASISGEAKWPIWQSEAAHNHQIGDVLLRKIYLLFAGDDIRLSINNGCEDFYVDASHGQEAEKALNLEDGIIAFWLDSFWLRRGYH